MSKKPILENLKQNIPIEEKQLIKNNSTPNILSSTMPQFKIKNQNENHVMKLTNFQGFFNKKFNLTNYFKSRELSRSNSKSPERIYIPTHKKGNGIPNEIIPRIKFIKELISKEKFKKYYNLIPRKKVSTLDDIVNYIIRYHDNNSELDTYLMICYYICQNIKYDLKGYEEKRNNKFNQLPSNIFKTNLALSSGFCNYFEYFCKKKNLKFKRIYGYCRLMPDLKNKINNSNNKNNHCWEAIHIKGEWYFVDLVFGSSSLNNYVPKNQNEIIDYFNPFYFLPINELFIMTHKPIEDSWQKVDKIMTDKQFFSKKLIDYGKFYHSFYKYNIILLTEDFPFIKINQKSLLIKLKVENGVIQANLFKSNGKDKVGEVKYTVDEDHDYYIIESTFPNYGDYVLEILIRLNFSSDMVLVPFLEYKIRVYENLIFQRFEKYKLDYNNKNKLLMSQLPKIIKRSNSQFYQPKIISDYNKVFPSKTNKKICFDNDKTLIIEPRNQVLRIGNDVKFKIKVKGASTVAVLDGRKFNYLKRIDEEIYEGQFVIQTDNVSVCSIRSSDVYTEIFRFKVNKESPYMSRRINKSAINLRHRK